ncbi:MAG: DSD1 family PLP-dependent enzyme [Oscillochloris sp.]|nr:DSD1 family PLP-dependent enzyme [Oscillochloris sp.]
MIELDTPALLVDHALVAENISTLMNRLRGSTVRVRPHWKTAKCLPIAQMLLAAGAQGLCAAKLGEAEALADGGIDDILITSELVGPTKLQRLVALQRRLRQLRVVVDSLDSARAIDTALSDHDRPLHVLIELNVGQDRCGVLPGAAALELARGIAMLPRLKLIGLQGYEGHLQHVSDAAQKAALVQAAMAKLIATATLLRREGFTIETLTTGGTGTCELCAAHPEISEVQPGSFVFFDGAYRRAMGAAGYRQALLVISTVISRPAAQRAVIDAGLKALSNDMGDPEPDKLLGVRYRPAGDEHGILEWDDPAWAGPAIGEQVALVPSHIDTTVNLYNAYHVRHSDGRVESWPIVGRGRSQ